MSAKGIVNLINIISKGTKINLSQQSREIQMENANNPVIVDTSTRMVSKMNELDMVMKEAAKITPTAPDWLFKSDEGVLTEIKRATWDKEFALNLEKDEELEKSLKFEWWDRKCKSECSDPSFIEKLTEFNDTPSAYINECSSIQDFESLFKHCGRINKVLLSDCTTRLEIIGEKLSFTAVAEGDCCSSNWFEVYKGYDFADLVGKEVSKVDTDHNEDYEASGNQDVDTHIVYELTFTDQSAFKFLFRNSSNGYYRGYVTVVSCRKTGTEETFVQNADARVVIVVGLPLSGKSTFMRENIQLSNVNAFDDCLFKPILLLHLKEKLERGERVVLNDPRLCELSKFQFLFNQIMRNLVLPSQIFIIYYENNPQQCIRNLVRPLMRRVLPEDITKFSAVYDETLTFISTLTDCLSHKLEVAFAEDLGNFMKRRQEELDV